MNVSRRYGKRFQWIFINPFFLLFLNSPFYDIDSYFHSSIPSSIISIALFILPFLHDYCHYSSIPFSDQIAIYVLSLSSVLLAMEKDKSRWDNEVSGMETHSDRRKSKEIWNFYRVNVVDYLRGPCKLQRFDEDTIHKVCGILDINTFEARSQSGNMIRCLYPTVAMLSHNCVSNVSHSIYTDGWGTPDDYRWDSRGILQSGNNGEIDFYRMFLRAALPLKKGEELFASYTYSMWPTMIRREYLREGKYFECNCARCSDPTELGTHMSTLKCTKNLCDNGVILSTNSLGKIIEQIRVIY